MRALLLALALVACSPAAPSADCVAMQEHVTECGGNTMPVCDECTTPCYAAAWCIEIDGRLNWPQPGEADGGTLYSTLDVCLARCA